MPQQALQVSWVAPARLAWAFPINTEGTMTEKDPIPYASDPELCRRIEAGLDAMNQIKTADPETREQVIAEAQAAGDWNRLVFLHSSRDWLDVFERHANEMPDAEYWPLLVRIYSTYASVSWAQERFLKLLSAPRPNRDLLMDAPSRHMFGSLPAEVRVYRGYAGATPFGISWTFSRRTARFFAYRAQEWGGGLPHQPAVLRGLALKSDILAIICSCNENEVVIDPRKVRQRQRKVLPNYSGNLEDLIA